MPYLIAQGPAPADTSKSRLDEGEMLQIGRFRDCDFSVSWDRLISRHHARLTWQDGQLSVSCHEKALNPIIYHGTRCKQVTMKSGEEFRIGGTVFRVVEEESSLEIRRFLENTASKSEAPTQYSLSVTDERLSLISRYSQALWLCADCEELAASLVNVLTEIIPHAGSISVVKSVSSEQELCCRPQIVHSGNRHRDEKILLSRPMIAAALKQRRTLIRVRRSSSSCEQDAGRWALCCPVLSGDAESENWCLCINGHYGPQQPLPSGLTTEDMASDVQVTEVVAHLGAAIRRVKVLEDRFAGIRQYFSPAVAEAVASSHHKTLLNPTECETAVLFCDLRGYSRIVQGARGHLHGLLDRVNQALEVMTQNIIQHDGVIADFQGDSTLGFWGWPLELESGALPACRAALDILRDFRRTAQRNPDSRLVPSRFGIGIAFGPGIAGRIGTRQQAKVGVFGPVVNLGSRLEGMTKQIGVPILIDRATAMSVRRDGDPSECRCRRIGLFSPINIDTPVEVYELLPPEEESLITNDHIRTFESAVEAFLRGDWGDSIELLSEMPGRDRAKDFLLLQIAAHNYEPPEDWDGVIHMQRK